jgi:hypothetical protein
VVGVGGSSIDVRSREASEEISDVATTMAGEARLRPQ